MRPVKNESTQMLEIWEGASKIAECSLNAPREQWSVFWKNLFRYVGLPSRDSTLETKIIGDTAPPPGENTVTLEWISAIKQLPTCECKCLVYRSNDYPRIAVEWFTHVADPWTRGFYSNGEQDTNVTHWIPLPEKP
jgi:hypothetical protein